MTDIIIIHLLFISCYYSNRFKVLYIKFLPVFDSKCYNYDDKFYISKY